MAADSPSPIQPRSPSTASSRRSTISRLLPSIRTNVPFEDWSAITKLPRRPKMRACTREARVLDDHVVPLVAAEAQRARRLDHEHAAAISELQVPLARDVAPAPHGLREIVGD